MVDGYKAGKTLSNRINFVRVKVMNMNGKSEVRIFLHVIQVQPIFILLIECSSAYITYIHIYIFILFFIYTYFNIRSPMAKDTLFKVGSFSCIKTACITREAAKINVYKKQN